MEAEQLEKGIILKKEIDKIKENLLVLKTKEEEHGIIFDKITIGKTSRTFECIVVNIDFADTMKFLIEKELNKQLEILESDFNCL